MEMSIPQVVGSVTCDNCGYSTFNIPVYDDGETEICCIECGEPLNRDMMIKKLQVRK